jgi:hypothetical protein
MMRWKVPYPPPEGGGAVRHLRGGLHGLHVYIADSEFVQQLVGLLFLIQRFLQKLSRRHPNSWDNCRTEGASELRDPLILYFAMLGKLFSVRQARA